MEVTCNNGDEERAFKGPKSCWNVYLCVIKHITQLRCHNNSMVAVLTLHTHMCHSSCTTIDTTSLCKRLSLVAGLAQMGERQTEVATSVQYI